MVDSKRPVADEPALTELEEARRYAPLDLLVEVVESRYRERRKQDRRWWIGMVVTAFTAYVGAGALYIAAVQSDLNTVERIADRAEAEASVANRRLDTPQQAALPPVQTLQPGDRRSIPIGADESVRFQLSGFQTRAYIIDAVADSDKLTVA